MKTNTRAKKPAEKKPTAKKPSEGKPAEKKPAEKKPTAKKPSEGKPAEKKPAGKKPASAYAVQLEVQAAEMVHELAREVAEILWERFQIECRRDALADAEIITHIVDLSSLPSPHAEATPEQVAEAVAQAVAEEVPDAEVLWRVYQGAPKGEG
jgi:hypothetical protein